MSLLEYYLWTYGIGIGVLLVLNLAEVISMSNAARSRDV